MGWRLYCSLQYHQQCKLGSEPTVWDGDFFFANLQDRAKRVPSPPCGMVTGIPICTSGFSHLFLMHCVELKD